MGLFGFGKKNKEKKSECGSSCGCSSKEPIARDTEQSRLIVLGACCSKSTQTFENVKIAAAELGLLDEVTNIGDMETIASYGVMSTPALIIDNKVVSVGKLIKVDEAKHLIQKSVIIYKNTCGCSDNNKDSNCCHNDSNECCSNK